MPSVKKLFEAKVNEEIEELEKSEAKLEKDVMREELHEMIRMKLAVAKEYLWKERHKEDTNKVWRAWSRAVEDRWLLS